jgi:hypothetical protein
MNLRISMAATMAGCGRIEGCAMQPKRESSAMSRWKRGMACLALIASGSSAMAQPPVMEPEQPPAMLPANTFLPPSVPVVAEAPSAVLAPAPSRPLVSSIFGLTQPDMPPRLWLDSEVILFRIKQKTLVPDGLISTGTIGDVGSVVNNLRSVTPSQLDYGILNGLKFTGGLWLDDDHVYGMEGGFWFLSQETVKASTTSAQDGNPLIVRPFFDTVLQLQNYRFVSYPGAYSGSAEFSSSVSLSGGEFSPFVFRAIDTPRVSGYGMIGFKYFKMNETLAIEDSVYNIPGSGAVQTLNGQSFGADTLTKVRDAWEISNRFYGGYLGARLSTNIGPVFLDVTGKFAMGQMLQRQWASGGTGLTSPTGAGLFSLLPNPGGLLVSSDIARRASTQQFTVIPELNAQAGLALTDRLSIFVGYSFMYVSNVMRASNQIDTTVNTTRLPTSTNFGTTLPGIDPGPQARFVQTNLTLHGISFGVSLRY